MIARNQNASRKGTNCKDVNHFYRSETRGKADGLWIEESAFPSLL